jgi:hypothetical protein
MVLLFGVKQGTYPESISLSSAKSLTIKGGYDSTYEQQTPNLLTFSK